MVESDACTLYICINHEFDHSEIEKVWWCSTYKRTCHFCLFLYFIGTQLNFHYTSRRILLLRSAKEGTPTGDAASRESNPFLPYRRPTQIHKFSLEDFIRFLGSLVDKSQVKKQAVCELRKR